MASSPSCSSTSPKDVHEADVFSDDSGVDVKTRRPHDVQETSSERRNKRKSSEPKRRKDVLLMKRFRWEDTDEEDTIKDEDDFDEVLEERPGSGDSGCCQLEEEDEEETPPPQPTKKRKTTKHGEVLLRQSVIRKNEAKAHCTPSHTEHKKITQEEKDSSSNPIHPQDESRTTLLLDESGCPQEDDSRTIRGSNRPARNYKSMSRQRRIEANARERTRVHTIGAAFESLRRAVPAYAHNQKLSKLAILRIASAYIVALACLNNDQPSEQSNMPECVEQCTRTIQAEGRSRRRTSKD